MNRVDEDVEIQITIKNKGNLLANANVLLDTEKFGIIALKGFQIWKSRFLNERLEKHINITPPSISIHGKSIFILYFENQEGWIRLERIIFDAYSQNKTNQNNYTEL